MFIDIRRCYGLLGTLRVTELQSNGENKLDNQENTNDMWRANVCMTSTLTC